MSRTIVAFHAHPDDEALLTAGTMARLAAQGHRVVLVLATDGGAGLAADELRRDGSLGTRRLHEARRSADVLGVARVEWLGYADSGSGAEPEPDAPGLGRFCRAPLEEAAERLAAILSTERADLLISYDANGGYGHRDHVRVHEVGALAARMAAPRACSRPRCPATPSSAPCARSAGSTGSPPSSTRPPSSVPSPRGPTSPTGSTSGGTSGPSASRCGRTPPRRPGAARHPWVTAAQTGDRTLGAFLHIPSPFYDLVFGREWYRNPALPAGGTPCHGGSSRGTRGPCGCDAASRSSSAWVWRPCCSSGGCRTSPRRRGPRSGRSSAACRSQAPSASRCSCSSGCGELHLLHHGLPARAVAQQGAHRQPLRVLGLQPPAGGGARLAATYGICRTWGFSRRATSTSAIVTGVWNVMARIALPVVAIGALWFGGVTLPDALTDLAVAGMVTGVGILAAFVAVMVSERAALAIGERPGPRARPPVPPQAPPVADEPRRVRSATCVPGSTTSSAAAGGR